MGIFSPFNKRNAYVPPSDAADSSTLLTGADPNLVRVSGGTDPETSHDDVQLARQATQDGQGGGCGAAGWGSSARPPFSDRQFDVACLRSERRCQSGQRHCSNLSEAQHGSSDPRDRRANYSSGLLQEYRYWRQVRLSTRRKSGVWPHLRLCSEAAVPQRLECQRWLVCTPGWYDLGRNFEGGGRVCAALLQQCSTGSAIWFGPQDGRVHCRRLQYRKERRVRPTSVSLDAAGESTYRCILNNISIDVNG